MTLKSVDTLLDVLQFADSHTPLLFPNLELTSPTNRCANRFWPWRTLWHLPAFAAATR